MYDKFNSSGPSNGTRSSSTLMMRDSVPIPESLTPNNRFSSSNIHISSRERSIYEQHKSREPALERQRYDDSRLINQRRTNGSTPDSRILSRASINETGGSGYNSQRELMMSMIRDTNLTLSEFQRSYSEKLNTAIARYPEQSKDWQLWYAEGVVWESHFSGKKFPGREPFKVPIIPTAQSAQSEPYVTIESFMEAKALKGGFRKAFFKALNAKRHEVNDRQPSAERHKKAYWVDNEIWSHFWPHEPFPVKDPNCADILLVSGRLRRPQKNMQPSQPPPRNLRQRELSPLPLPPPPPPPLQSKSDTVNQETEHPTKHSKQTVQHTQNPKTTGTIPINQSNPNVDGSSTLCIIQSCAPAHILQGLLETQKNWRSKSPVNGRIIMINKIPVICNDNPKLPREIFDILKSEDDQRGWDVQTGIGCRIQCTSVSTGDLLLWTTSIGSGNPIPGEAGNQFLQGWIQRILTHGMVTMSTHWKDLQNHSSNQLAIQEISSESEGENSREAYMAAFRPTDLDMMVIEETAKAEGNLRLVLDEETGEVITLAELIKRSKQRCLQGLPAMGVKRKSDRVELSENKRPCP
ncbi:hypothetical protein OnM2_034041 [Erysiphe neolycopersici]|uniref:Uncharacterized protein n=1 Tax=Erysiphe neolycopersici TaxID=212602 RepID=A0A420HY50_9PEZI|nr:hypothetical protein OnM2_034041 [Erysiphe neolycopersici]